MKSSGNSSATGANPSSRSEPARRSFALTGPSAPLDPRTQAVRRDLADVRLAGQVFAPHFAAPLPCVVAHVTPLLDSPGGAVVADLFDGEPFEVLEIAGDHAWGRAPGPGLVGYLDRDALGTA